MIRIKICGHTRVEDMILSYKLGAHAIGFIFNIPSSLRNNDKNKAKKFVRSSPPLVDTVPVTTLDNFYDAISLGTKTVQIIGDIEKIYNLKLEYENVNIVPVLYINNDYPDFRMLKFYSEFNAIIVDTKNEGKLGGSGLTHNWEISRRISKELGNVILAGGLNENNVVEAITKVEPIGVDVSSGVESYPGIKDPVKVKNFIRRVFEYA